MKEIIKKKLFIALGWLCILAGAIGALLPILPTTPFLILALALFANSSPRFHQMLLDNRWLGSTLKQWDKSKTISRAVKMRASLLILLSFSISIGIVCTRWQLQLMLVAIGVTFLIFIWRLKEQ